MKKFLKILFGTILVLFIVFVVLLIFTSPYSKDQRKIIEAFGLPDSFEVTMNVYDEPMMESWKYLELSKVFIFADQKYVESVDFEFSELETSQAILNAPLEPSDVYYLTDVKDLESKLDISPDVSTLNDDVLENASFLNYGNLVHVGVFEDKPVFVKTLSYSVPIEDSDTSTVSTEEIDKPSNQVSEEEVVVFTGEKYIDETYGFSLILPDSWKNNYNVVEDFDFDSMRSTITFQYLVPSPYADGVQGEIDVFTIEAYFEEPSEEEVMYSEFLGNNNVYFLYYSHFNGDIAPLDHPIWEYSKIIESLEIFEAAVG